MWSRLQLSHTFTFDLALDKFQKMEQVDSMCGSLRVLTALLATVMMKV